MTEGIWTVGPAVTDGETVPPCFLGAASYVARNARVQRSVIGAGARVLEGARVIDSVLLPGAVVRANATVTRSLVGENAVIGEDSVLDDLTVVGGGIDVPAGSLLSGARIPVA